MILFFLMICAYELGVFSFIWFVINLIILITELNRTALDREMELLEKRTKTDFPKIQKQLTISFIVLLIQIAYLITYYSID